jgi:glutamine synthetase
MRVPEDLFILTVTGRYSWQESPVSDASGDVYMVPDATTLKPVPWHVNPTAQVICDTHYLDDEPVDISPRHVLQAGVAVVRRAGLEARRGAGA